jgi:hypothetical protein
VLKAAAAVITAEGVLSGVLGVIEAFSLDGDRLGQGVTSALFLVLYGAGLLYVGRGLARAARWSRGPAVLTQLIQLGVAWSFWGHSTSWLAVLLGLAAAAVLVAIFLPDSTRALVGTTP